MSHIVYPDILSGHPEITAFFTGKDPGVDVSGIAGMPVYFPRQEHTGDAVVFEGDMAPAVADAVATSVKGVALGLQVADCVPILLYDPSAGAIGAVHAGWRGTALGILRNTVRLMSEAFNSRASDIVVAIGPSIRWCCYRVGRDVLDAVSGATGEGDYYKEMDGGLCLDLQSANKYQALSVKIPEENIEVIEECTSCHPDRYCSYRYSRGIAGRQGAFVGMK